MTKAIFFDWFNTLAVYDPPREELQSQVLREFGIDISPLKVLRGLLVADNYWFAENIKSPVLKRASEEQAEVWIHYESIILAEAGVKADDKDLLLKIIKRVEQLFKNLTFVLFDDVLSTLEILKKRNLTLGLLTNATKNVVSVYGKLGLGPYLDFVVTSEEVGRDKPEPPIFLVALQKAGVNAAEAVHVGDQYKIDIVGARGVGINPILIDRYDLYPEISDCPRIRRLGELVKYL